MPQVKIILILLFLAVLAGCSAVNVDSPLPPDYLLQRPVPLEKKPVVLTSDVVERALVAEAAYALLADRMNILIDWIIPTGS